MDATGLLGRFRVVPVVVIDDPKLAVQLAETLLCAGIKVMEITLRTEGALSSIEAVAKNVPDMLVGAGSVRNVQQFADVSNAGAGFAVSPGTTSALINAATNLQLPYVPGAATASEMIVLLEIGYRLQKFFPAEAAGGIEFLKSVESPIPEVRFMPTGGISEALAVSYLALPNVSAVGGSWIAPAKLITENKFDEIRTIAARAAPLGV